MATEFAKKNRKNPRPNARWGDVGLDTPEAIRLAKKTATAVPNGQSATPAGSMDERAAEGSTLESLGIARIQTDSPAEANPRPTRGVLVVGMGDVERGDDGIGVHLTGCLAGMPWPGSIEFCLAGPDVPQRAEQYARVVLLEAIDGPEAPGSLYQANADELLATSVGGPEAGLGLLSMLSPSVRKRLSIYGIQPRHRSYGSDISEELIQAMSSLVPYLRTRILQAAADTQMTN